MKNKFLFFCLLFMTFSLVMKAQDIPSSKKILYKYTFEGMKDSTEIAKLSKEVMQLKGVTLADVIFKSADHQYALLKVEVLIPEVFNENSKDITGPSDLKKTLIKLGYTPAQCNTYNEN